METLDSPAYTSCSQTIYDDLSLHLLQILWVDGTRGRAALPGEETEMRDAVARAAGMLLGQLYDRNCRRAFVPTEAFYAPQLSEDLFNAEVQSSLAHGAFLEAKRTRVWQVLRCAPPSQADFAVSHARRARVGHAEVYNHQLRPRLARCETF